VKRAAQTPRLDLPVERNPVRHDSCLRGNQKAPLLITLTPAAYYPHARCLPSRLRAQLGATPPPPPHTGK
jgi:hypothetical protein